MSDRERRRFKPNDWPAPKKRGWWKPKTEPVPMTVASLSAILKKHYRSDGLDAPRWAYYALKHRWMTPAQFDAVPKVRVPTIAEIMFAESPVFRTLSRSMRP